MEKISLSNPMPAAPQPGDSSYVPPAEIVPLPSRGKVYPVDHPLHGAEHLEIKAMTAKEEDILTSRALLRTGKVVDTLLRSCLTNKLVDPSELLIGDRNAALIAIRITGYGAEYTVEVECPSCGAVHKNDFNLSTMPVKSLGADPVEPGVNLFSKVLPSGREVKFSLMTGNMDRELSVTLERMKKTSGGLEQAVTTRLILQVKSLGGTTDQAKLADMIRNMPASDSRALRKFIDDITPGVEMKQEFNCPDCGNITEVDVPLGTEFFWPSG